MSNYENERQTSKLMTKQAAIDEVNAWIKAIPPEKINQVVASAGAKSFTAQELLNEIQNGTEYGVKLVSAINKLRMEAAKNTGKPNLSNPTSQATLTTSSVLTQNLISQKIGNIKPWWYITKKLLIIRSELPGDGFTGYSFVVAGNVKTAAITAGWTVTDLQMNAANRTAIVNTINSNAFDLILHYDHGSDYAMYGQDNNQIEAVIDNNDVSLLKGKAVSTVSCDTAVGLGPLAIAAGARAYLGYSDLNWVYYAWESQFGAAANAANLALLHGQTFQQAHNAAIVVFNQMIQYILSKGDTVAAAALLHNRDCFTLLGNPNAFGYGTHFLILDPIVITKPVITPIQNP